MDKKKWLIVGGIVVVIVVLMAVAVVINQKDKKQIGNQKETVEQNRIKDMATLYLEAIEKEIAEKIHADANYVVPDKYTNIDITYSGDKPSTVSLVMKENKVTDGLIIINNYVSEIKDGKVNSVTMLKKPTSGSGGGGE